MHLCVAGKVNRNGLYLVDIRLGESGDCHFLEDCCDVGDIKITTPTTLKPTSIVQTTLPPYVVTPVDPEIFVTPGVIPNTEKPTGEASNFDMRCGKRNPNGIGYRILEVVDHEAEYGWWQKIFLVLVCRKIKFQASFRGWWLFSKSKALTTSQTSTPVVALLFTPR